jgi:cell division protein FtsI/penicillin-binding protein 2
VARTVCLALVGALTACSSGEDPRTRAARTTFADLAAALAAANVTGLPGADQQQFHRIITGMHGLARQVTVAEVKVDGDAATAVLNWAWRTTGTQWSYQTQAKLTALPAPTTVPLGSSPAAQAQPSASGSAAPMTRAYEWAVQWSPSLVEPSLVAGEVLSAETKRARRAQILGSDSRALVRYRPVVRFGIDKGAVPASEAPSSAAQLAALLGVDPKAFAKTVKAAGSKDFVVALVLREADADRIDPSLVKAIRGARTIADEMPLAPSRNFAAAILGRVGPATAQIVAKSEGLIHPEDEVGISGLQSRYEAQLGGVPGITITAGTPGNTRTLFVSEPAAGTDLATTLDGDVQRAAESALSGVKPASALVALRPSTGEILAAANGQGSNGYNTATFGRYPPGSTMKLASALAYMRAGISPDDNFDCSPELVVDGKRFTNYDGYPASGLGRLTLRSAVANSCNTAIISQYKKLPDDALSQAAAALGLGVDRDLGFPAFFGQVPVPTSETEKAADLIGQGRVLASPMAMAAVAASIAKGEVVVPKLLPEQPVVPLAPKVPLTAAEAKDLRALMRAVVTEGTAGFLRNIPGPPVGAKTGTAEFGTTKPLPTHTWMIAIQGDLAVAVFVEVGKSGSQTAGPILEEFLRALR